MPRLFLLSLRLRRKALLRAGMLCACWFFASIFSSLDAWALDTTRYVDRDGDGIADPPTDPKRHADPATLVFSVGPVEDPAVYAKTWAGFVRHLEKVTGRKVRYYAVPSNAAQVEAMRAGRLHVAGFATGTTPLAVACAGFVPFAVMADATGRSGYEMEIVTSPGSGITRLSDLAGRKVAFTSETSNSGYKVPALLLRETLNFEAGRDYTAVFSGKHDNSLLGVANRDYDAAAISNSVLRAMVDRGVVRREQFVSLYRSPEFPGVGYGYAHDLAPALAQKIRTAFLTFPWAGSDMAREFGLHGEQHFQTIDYRTTWAPVLRVDRAMGVTNDCR